MLTVTSAIAVRDATLAFGGHKLAATLVRRPARKSRYGRVADLRCMAVWRGEHGKPANCSRAFSPSRALSHDGERCCHGAMSQLRPSPHAAPQERSLTHIRILAVGWRQKVHGPSLCLNHSLTKVQQAQDGVGHDVSQTISPWPARLAGVRHDFASAVAASGPAG